MKKSIVFVGITLLCCTWAAAQSKVRLQNPKQQRIEVYLYDDDNDNFLFTLPLTFSITDKNVLVMMVGDDTRFTNGQTVWMFSENLSLPVLMKKNKNVSASKAFKQRHSELNPVLITHKRITLFRNFDDGCETVIQNTKPVFFSIQESATGTLTFYLQFYVAKSDSKYPYILTAKCKLIEIELTL